MGKEIPIKGGEVAVVDDEDFPVVSRYSWRMSNSGYAMTTFKFTDDAEHTVYLHKLIMGMGCFGVCDHINQNRLDCRKENLRRATYQENGWNSRKQLSAHGKPCSSKYKGVTRVVSKTKGVRWFASIKDGDRYSGKVIRIGYFATEDEAARAYNAKALELRGDKAWLNPVQEVV